MAINLKVRNHINITEDTRSYIQKRFSKIEKLLPSNSFIEVEFIDQFGERGGLDKKVQVDVSIPGEKHSIHLENSASDWNTSIDILKDRLETDLIRNKEKHQDEHRQPRSDKES